MNFIALDVETANADMSSICQIGLAKYVDGKLDDVWDTLINPEDYFDEINVSIHGISSGDVVNSPKFVDITDRFTSLIKHQIVVCHSHFDRVAIKQAFEKHNLCQPDCTWLDTARVARRTWSEFAFRGYGLKNICNHIGYQYKAHNALEDAKASAFLLISAIKKTNIDLNGWLTRVDKPIANCEQIKRDGNLEGPLFGEVIVFTGSLSIPRSKAAEIASKIGCKVQDSVTKETTILVVGDQDIQKLNGNSKSTKHKKAETLINQGQSIRILCETDFKELVNLTPDIEIESNPKTHDTIINQDRFLVADEHLKYFKMVKEILIKNQKNIDYLSCSYTGDYLDINTFYDFIRINIKNKVKYVLSHYSQREVCSYWKEARCEQAAKRERGITRIFIDSIEELMFLEKMVLNDFDRAMESLETYRKNVKCGEKNVTKYLKSCSIQKVI